MISIVGAAVAGTWTDTVTISVPEQVRAGDRLFVFAGASDQVGIVSQPPQWSVLMDTQLNPGASTHVWVFTQTVADGDPDSYTVVWEGTHWHQLHLVAVRGVSHIRTQEAATTTGVNAPSLPVPVVEANAGDHLLVGGYHWDAVTKQFVPAGLEVIAHQERGWITGHQPITVTGPTPAYEVTDTVDGLMATIAIVLVPPPPPPPPVSFPLAIRTQIRLDEGWVDISADVRDTEDVTISRGRADEAATADSSQLTLVLNNRHGRYSPRNPNSPYFGQLRRNTPLRLGIAVGDEVLWRWAGEVSEWPMRWDLSDNDTWIDLTGNGLLRRFAQGDGAERSAIRRLVAAHRPLAYWPIVDGGTSTVSRPDVGPHEMVAIDLIVSAAGNLTVKRDHLDWGQGSLEPWLEDVAQTRTDRGGIIGRIDWSDDATQAWSADMVRAGTGGTDRFTVVTHTDPGGEGAQWRIRMDYSVPDIRVFVREFEGSPEGAPAFTELAVLTEPRFFGEEMRHMRLEVMASGASSSAWRLLVDGRTIGSGTAAGVEMRPPASAEYRWNYIDEAENMPDDAGHVALGHVTVWAGADELTVPTASDVRRALDGYQGERAGVRIERIAREEGITLQVVGDMEQTPPMGAQYAESPLEVMRDCERVDHGMLFEARDEVALVYRSHRSRYLQSEAAGPLGLNGNGASNGP